MYWLDWLWHLMQVSTLPWFIIAAPFIHAFGWLIERCEREPELPLDHRIPANDNRVRMPWEGCPH